MCGSDDNEDDEAGQQQRRRRRLRSLAGARRTADVARVLAAAERARGRPRRRHAVHTQRRRFVHLQAARRVHRAYLVDGQLLAHGGVIDDCLASIHRWLAVCRSVLVARVVVPRVLACVASQSGDTVEQDDYHQQGDE